MKRDLNILANTLYDLVIIGAGIYGACAAWDAALRGLRVALIERGDFGNATSSNSFKTIHGGLRYLQSLDIKRMRESILERTNLMRTAPYLIHPLPFVMPTYGYGTKNRFVMSVALKLNDLIGFDRNRLSDPQKYLPAGRVISKDEVKRYTGIDWNGFKGGALWYDCQCFNTERLLLSYILSAAEKGADIANYLECTGFIVDKERIAGVKVDDRLAGDSFNIRAKTVLNTAGPWVDTVLKGLKKRGIKTHFVRSSAANIIIKKRLLKDCALGLPARYEYIDQSGRVCAGERILFFAPWREHTIIGTDHRSVTANTDNGGMDEERLNNFLSDINKAFPEADIEPDDITFVHYGLLPMRGVDKGTGEVDLQKKYEICDHNLSDGVEGLVSVVGVKLTTHRYVVERAINVVFKKLRRSSPPCKTGTTPIFGGDIGCFNDFLYKAVKDFSAGDKVITHLVYSYGSRIGDILRYGEDKPALLKTVSDSKEVVAAEVVNAVREEMAVKLSDVVLRRTDIGSAGYPGDSAVNEIAGIMAHELGWNEEHKEQEVNEVKSLYSFCKKARPSEAPLVN